MNETSEEAGGEEGGGDGRGGNEKGAYMFLKIRNLGFRDSDLKCSCIGLIHSIRHLPCWRYTYMYASELLTTLPMIPLPIEFTALSHNSSSLPCIQTHGVYFMLASYANSSKVRYTSSKPQTQTQTPPSPTTGLIHRNFKRQTSPRPPDEEYRQYYHYH